MKAIFSQQELTKLYLHEKKSVYVISQHFSCSQNKVNYWLTKYKIKKRTISEALYIKLNPKGDPFEFSEPQDKKSAFLLGMGLGLYWGEGNKKNEISFYTLVIWLNNDYTGGELHLDGGDIIKPVLGGGFLLMQNSHPYAVRHEALPVETGTKYILRTDLFYTC